MLPLTCDEMGVGVGVIVGVTVSVAVGVTVGVTVGVAVGVATIVTVRGSSVVAPLCHGAVCPVDTLFT